MAEQKQILHVQIIPVGGGDAILPNTAIAEIVPYLEPKKISGTPGWFLGLLPWRGLEVPLISIEAATGGNSMPSTKSSRVAVINTLNADSKFNFFAFLTQGIPHLAKVTRESLVPKPMPDGVKNILASATLAGDPMIVPDIEKLGALILKSVKFK